MLLSGNWAAADCWLLVRRSQAAPSRQQLLLVHWVHLLLRRHWCSRKCRGCLDNRIGRGQQARRSGRSRGSRRAGAAGGQVRGTAELHAELVWLGKLYTSEAEYGR